MESKEQKRDAFLELMFLFTIPILFMGALIMGFVSAQTGLLTLLGVFVLLAIRAALL